jgi:antirestriction protein ArdC
MSTSNAQQLRRMVLDLANAIVSPEGDETFDRYLSFISRFHHYSPANVALILSQKPTATLVNSYLRWNLLGRHIRRGEKGIKILAPLGRRKEVTIDLDTGQEKTEWGPMRFRAVCVFDVSQTEGPAVPNFKRNLGDDVRPLRDAALRFAEQQGIEVHLKPIYGETNGVSSGGRVTLNSTLPVGVQAQTILHELAHELLHHAKGDMVTCRTLREGEAEAVCSVCLRHWGIDTSTNSAHYMRAHGVITPQVVLASLERICTTAKTIIDGTTPFLPQTEAIVPAAQSWRVPR